MGSGAEVLVHFDGAVPVRVGEKASHIAEVHDVETEFAFALTDARTTTHYLLEFGHRVDVLVKHDEFHHLAVDAGGEQFAGGCDNWIFR